MGVRGGDVEVRGAGGLGWCISLVQALTCPL